MCNEYQVDVIVPVYNVEKYLTECIESIINQSYKNINLILIDDGSEDSSGRICDEWSRKDHRISVIHKDNGGLVSAWRVGLSASKNDWVLFVDSDDWIEINYISSLVKEQIRVHADIVVTRMKQVGNGINKYIPFIVEAKNYAGNTLREELYPVMINAGGFEKRGVPFSRCGKLIRKKLVLDNLKYSYVNATFEEDFNIMAPILMDAGCISLIEVENAAYCYRRVEKSMSHGYNKSIGASIDHIYPLLFRACKDKGKLIFETQIKAEYLSAKIRHYTNELRNDVPFSKINNHIMVIANDEMLSECIAEKKIWLNYPLKFKIVLFAIKNHNHFYGRLITRIFRMGVIILKD